MKAAQKPKPSSSHDPLAPKTSEFLCPLRYLNELPSIPYDAKFLSLSEDNSKFYKNSITTLETEYKHQIHTEADIGISIDLIDPSSYKPPAVDESVLESILSPEDLKLLAGNSSADTKTSKRRMESVRPSVPWLRKTEYISVTEHKSKDEPKSKQKKQKEESKESQIQAIEDTFTSAKLPPKNPKNPALEPVEILPILPDFDLWKHTFTMGVFDRDPSPNVIAEEEELEEMKSNCILQSFGGTDGTVEAFLAYLVPVKPKKKSQETTSDDDEDEEEEEEEYRWVREYSYAVHRGHDDAGSYFFNMKNGHVSYGGISARVNFTSLPSEKTKSFPKPSKIFVKTHTQSINGEDFPEHLVQQAKENMKNLVPSGEEQD